ncbi:molybdopterin-dependent oxidoreductase [Spirosoma sp. KUDC1026]|uniref:molybdopterin-dependent oxidoreductase n=1 Tax=Spirosoma sp. KUDC1026 TaxID=2745947 RepID=UPI00159B84FD|nr:molybdopterin-dependent oxidoreductase [Spirosoma sp. KUDC1026]QKZ14998.1 molybdopterin-dependent oxidoreductase [Spirosoma sp. KUDC1026]
MSRSSLSRFTLLFLGALIAASSYAQPITISGEVTKSLTLQPADLKAMPHTTVTAKDRDGKEHSYAGIPLVDLLKQAGASTGGELRGENLAKYVIVTAADSYKALFSLPELDPEFTNRMILLADSVDGMPLPAEAGPYRIIVPDEKKPTRWIRKVTSIDVRFAK